MKNLTHIMVICLSGLAGAGGWLAVRRWSLRPGKSSAFCPTEGVDYACLTVEELAMRFRCSDIYLAADGQGDPHAQAFDELLRRDVIRAGMTRAEALVFLGDPCNVVPGSPEPYDSLAYFEYDYLCGKIVLHFENEKLRRIMLTREGGGCGQRNETLLC